MKPDRKQHVATLEFHDLALNSGEARFSLALAPGELALFEAGEAARAGLVGDAALGLAQPAAGEVRFQGTAWTFLAPGEAERCRRTVGRVWVPEEGSTWLQNLDVDENIQLAQLFDPGQSRREVMERASAVARRFGLDGLPRMRPAVAKRRTLQLAQWVRAFLPRPLALLILDLPLRGAQEGDAAALLDQVAAAREAGTAVLWVEKASAWLRERGLQPTVHFPEVPAALRPEA